MAAALAAASRDPVASLREDDPNSPDCMRVEERRSKSAWHLHRSNSRLKPKKKFGWCEESEGQTPQVPQTSSRALSVVSTAASSQDEVPSPIHGAGTTQSRPARSLWLGDFADLPGPDKEVPPVAISPKVTDRGLAHRREAPLNASPSVTGRGPSPKISDRSPPHHAEEEAAPIKAEPLRRLSYNQSAWVANGAPGGHPPVAIRVQEAGSGGGSRSRPRTPCRKLGSHDNWPRSADRRLSGSKSSPTDTPMTRQMSGEKAIQRLDEGGKIYDLYVWDKVLQEEGNGGKVVVCRPKGSGHEYVMKIRSRAELRRVDLEDQFCRVMERMLNMPRHPGVVRIFEVLMDDAFLYVVMEKANGGPLFGSLVQDFKDGCMPAPAVKQVMRDILEAVGHVHRQGMLHRDIKPDNLVMHTQGGAFSGSRGRKRVMLIDFDHADPEWGPCSTAEESDEVFGTLRFNAPEALLGSFQPQGDLYSVGVILYLLMTGSFPYPDAVFADDSNGAAGAHASWRRRRAVHGRMGEAQIDFGCNPWPEQPACRDLCCRLLAFEARDRPVSAGEALRHDWFRQEDSTPGGRPLQ